MLKNSPSLLLADDDADDRSIFKDALDELPESGNLETVKDGEELMRYLHDTPDDLPDVLFLDLNMPRKTGAECLTEIKADDKLKKLIVIIFSTTFDPHTISALYDQGANFYMSKPVSFAALKHKIKNALSRLSSSGHTEREDFVLD